MPDNILAEFTIVYIKRADDFAPPFVALTMDQERASAEALQWAEAEFGPGEYRAVGGESIGRMQGSRWGERIS